MRAVECLGGVICGIVGIVVANGDGDAEGDVCILIRARNERDGLERSADRCLVDACHRDLTGHGLIDGRVQYETRCNRRSGGNTRDDDLGEFFRRIADGGFAELDAGFDRSADRRGTIAAWGIDLVGVKDTIFVDGR